MQTKPGWGGGLNTIDFSLSVVIMMLIALIAITEILVEINKVYIDAKAYAMQKRAISRSDKILSEPKYGVISINEKTHIVMPGELEVCPNTGKAGTITRVGVVDGKVCWFKV